MILVGMKQGLKYFYIPLPKDKFNKQNICFA